MNQGQATVVVFMRQSLVALQILILNWQIE